MKNIFICVGRVKLWDISKIIEFPIIYSFLNCNVKDILCASMGNKFINVEEQVLPKITNWTPREWNQNDLIHEDPYIKFCYLNNVYSDNLFA
jgi:hypothetical protein